MFWACWFQCRTLRHNGLQSILLGRSVSRRSRRPRFPKSFDCVRMDNRTAIRIRRGTQRGFVGRSGPAFSPALAPWQSRNGVSMICCLLLVCDAEFGSGQLLALPALVVLGTDFSDNGRSSLYRRENPGQSVTDGTISGMVAYAKPVLDRTISHFRLEASPL